MFGGLPPEILNAFFFLRDPTQSLRKFPKFTEEARVTARGRLFVAIEDWLNDGVRVSAPAARDLFLSWVGGRTASRRETGGSVADDVDLRAVAQASLVVASRADTVTPEASSLAMLRLLPDATHLAPRGGWGMLVSGRGRRPSSGPARRLAPRLIKRKDACLRHAYPRWKSRAVLHEGRHANVVCAEDPTRLSMVYTALRRSERPRAE